MNRTRTYSEFKELLNTELEMFNFCLSTNTIYKSEFTKLRRMFKGLLRKEKLKKNDWYNSNNPYHEEFIKIEKVFDTYINYNGHYVPFSKITDLNLKQFHIDYPNLQEQYDKLLSMKESIRLGRRPKNLEKDYEAERLKKAAEENKATCGICNQHWELVDMEGEGQKFGLSKNVIADHGFTIKFGNGRNGVCFGARFHCWEKSPKVKIEYVNQVLKPILAKVIKAKPTDKDVIYIQLLFSNYKMKMEEYNKLDYTERCKTERPERPEYRLAGQQIGTIISKEEIITLEYLTNIWSDYKTHLENEIARFETAIKNWKLQPTPRERLKEISNANLS